MFKKNRLLISLILVSAVHSLSMRSALGDDDLLQLMGKASEAGIEEESDAPVVIKKTPLRKILPQATAEQNIFIDFFEKGDLEKALYQWSSAFDESEFAKTQNGRALYALVLFKNGFPVYGLERLLAIEEPDAIAEILKKWWDDAAPEKHQAWSHLDPSAWNEKWVPLFGPLVDVRIRSRKVFGPEHKSEIAELIKRSPKNSLERSWLEWQSVLQQGIEGDSGGAARSLSNLMKAKPNPVDEDLLTLTAARMLYQNGFLDAAIKYYEKVPKKSEDWFDAQEEMSWAMLRKGEPQNALAITRTLMNPAFVNLIGPESVFVHAVAHLKVCDYPEVGKTFDVFRDRFRKRAKNLSELSENPQTPAALTLLNRLKQGPVAAKTLGADAAGLPRFSSRDEFLARNARSEAVLDAEAAKFGEMYARSLSQGTSKIGFQAKLELLRKEIEGRARAARSASLGRIKTLAQDELIEIETILKKMHIVEAEILQQVSLADRVAKATEKSVPMEKKGTTGSRIRDRLIWPNESETWFDELASYQVDLKKGCQSVKR